MEYIYAALLLHKAGKDITEEAVVAILQAAGIEVNDARAKALIAALEDVDIEEAMATAAVAAVAAPAAAGAPPAAAEEAPAEEEAAAEEEESAEEDGMAGLGALFG
ncbi:MAG: 50S ribosomal protein P1 [Methanosarcinaceae archaeon]|nr:50S ribosomal protein P1 [Methanosarcinaceae archaeon]